MKFEYKPGVRYNVLVGGESVLQTASAGQSPITKAVQSGIAKLLYGKVDSITVQGDDGTLVTLRVTTMVAKDVKGPVEMLAGTKWLLMAEINNDEESANIGDVSLGMCLESIGNGYNPDPDDELDMGPVKIDLERLISVYGPDKLAEELLTEDDWQERADGDLQEKARKGF